MLEVNSFACIQVAGNLDRERFTVLGRLFQCMTKMAETTLTGVMGLRPADPLGAANALFFLTERNEACADLLQPEFDSCKKKKKGFFFPPPADLMCNESNCIFFFSLTAGLQAATEGTLTCYL